MGELDDFLNGRAARRVAEKEAADEVKRDAAEDLRLHAEAVSAAINDIVRPFLMKLASQLNATYNASFEVDAVRDDHLRGLGIGQLLDRSAEFSVFAEPQRLLVRWRVDEKQSGGYGASIALDGNHAAQLESAAVKFAHAIEASPLGRR